MLLSINSAPIASLESAVDTLACCEAVIRLEVQRVEDEAALHQLLEQVCVVTPSPQPRS